MYTLSPIIFSPTVDMGSGKKKKTGGACLDPGRFHHPGRRGLEAAAVGAG